MMPVKTIVQGVPLNLADLRHSIHSRADCPTPGNCVDKDKLSLKQLFNQYGPSTCSYLWSDEIKQSQLEQFPYDNFAHITFQNASDASRACYAAKNREIIINDHVLTLTLVSSSTAPIALLNDNCLLEIFSRLDVDGKLAVENVCKRWKALVLKVWSATRNFELKRLPCEDESKFKKCLMRCGTYLENMTVNVKSSSGYHLIRDYCKNVTSLMLGNVALEKQNFFEDISEMLKSLTKLKYFVLKDCTEAPRYDILESLPKGIGGIMISYTGPFYMCLEQQSFDLSKFCHLRSLKLHSFIISEGGLKGIENMTRLTHLDLNGCIININRIKGIQNCSELETLHLGNCSVNDDVMKKILLNNRNLKSVDVTGNDDLTDDSIFEISSLPRLKYLSLDLCDKIMLNSINKMPFLETLSCAYCERVTNQSVCKLILLAPKLKVLNIRSCSITDELPHMVNSVITKRNSDVVLSIASDITDLPKGLSPLLIFNSN